MKKTNHEKFLQELRAPVLNAEKAQNSRKNRGSHPVNATESQRSCPPERPDAFDISLDDDDDLLAVLESKFDELFGALDDD